MSLEKVRSYFKSRGIAERIMEFDSSSATVELAARALNCECARIAKTLSFQGEDGVLLIVAAGDVKIDNKKFRQYFGFKAKMLPAGETEARTGHAAGGVCPFAVNEGVRVYLDESLKRFCTVFPACGSSNSAVELTIPELERLSGYTAWTDVCRAAQPAD